MTVDDLLVALAAQQITLFLDGGRLRYRAPAGALAPELRSAIAAIVERLRCEQQAARATGKCLNCDRPYWVDDPPKDGRIRTTCGKCGQFIGYRLQNF